MEPVEKITRGAGKSSSNPGISRGMRKILIVIVIVSIIGLIAAAYAATLHYKPEGSSFCNLGKSFNCDVVNKSAYATILGVPVAFVGILGYLVIILVSSLYLFGFNEFPIEDPLLIMSGLGFAFSMYLTFIEAFVLRTWCILCMTSAAMITAVLILSIVLARLERQHNLTAGIQENK